MEQFDQLLTCAICLDRYRNPKLLPCQHSFCADPCLDGLVDYVRRQIKCPECRGEHHIPYAGVQAFPTNVTLQRFLELHGDITGELPDPTANMTLERCGVCSEKSYCSLCNHCDKKVCAECKEAHMDVLKREIQRVNNQVKRGVNRLHEAMSTVEKQAGSLQSNCTHIIEEIDDIAKRITKAIRDKAETLKREVETYLSTEQQSLALLKENLDIEISNITSNSELADKHFTEGVEWEDLELLDAKQNYLRTVEFIRNFDCEAHDYNRRLKLVLHQDPNALVSGIVNIGEVVFPTTTISSLNASTSAAASSSANIPGLLRSKSDHRLAAQFRENEENLAKQLLGGDSSKRRYGRGEGDGEHESRSGVRSRYRSRFTRAALGVNDDDSDSENAGSKSRAQSRPASPQPPREKVLDTEDVTKGPLSGILRLYDSPRISKRLQDGDCKEKKKEKAKYQPAPPSPKPAPAAPPPVPTYQRRTTSRQVSEEDEITKQKRLNRQWQEQQAGGASGGTDSKTSTTTTGSPSVTSTVTAESTPTPTSTTAASSSSSSAPAPSYSRQSSSATTTASSEGLGSGSASRKTSSSDNASPSAAAAAAAVTRASAAAAAAASAAEDTSRSRSARNSRSSPEVPRTRQNRSTTTRESTELTTPSSSNPAEAAMKPTPRNQSANQASESRRVRIRDRENLSRVDEEADLHRPSPSSTSARSNRPLLTRHLSFEAHDADDSDSSSSSAIDDDLFFQLLESSKKHRQERAQRFEERTARELHLQQRQQSQSTSSNSQPSERPRPVLPEPGNAANHTNASRYRAAIATSNRIPTRSPKASRETDFFTFDSSDLPSDTPTRRNGEGRSGRSTAADSNMRPSPEILHSQFSIQAIPSTQALADTRRRRPHPPSHQMSFDDSYLSTQSSGRERRRRLQAQQAAEEEEVILAEISLPRLNKPRILQKVQSEPVNYYHPSSITDDHQGDYLSPPPSASSRTNFEHQSPFSPLTQYVRNVQEAELQDNVNRVLHSSGPGQSVAAGFVRVSQSSSTGMQSIECGIKIPLGMDQPKMTTAVPKVPKPPASAASNTSRSHVKSSALAGRVAADTTALHSGESMAATRGRQVESRYNAKENPGKRQMSQHAANRKKTMATSMSGPRTASLDRGNNQSVETSGGMNRNKQRLHHQQLPPASSQHGTMKLSMPITKVNRYEGHAPYHAPAASFSGLSPALILARRLSFS